MTRTALLEAVVAEVRELDRRYRAIIGHPAAGSDKVLAAVASLDAHDAAAKHLDQECAATRLPGDPLACPACAAHPPGPDEPCPAVALASAADKGG